MDKSLLKEMAYNQQINHVAQAQTQALKILIEENQPQKLTVDTALSYLDLVKSKLGPQQFPEFLQIMKENRNPNSDCMVIVSKVCNLFKNYPELLQGFGMFLPPNVNLQVQTAGRFLIKGENSDVFPLFIKTEDDSSDQNRSSESTLTAVSESDSTMEDLLDDNEEAERAESMSKELKEVDKDYAVKYLAKVKERFRNQPEISKKFTEILELARRDCLQGERVGLETDVFLEISDLFQAHSDLIEEFKSFVPHAAFPEPSEHDPNPDDQNPEIDSTIENEDSFNVDCDSEEEITKYSLVNDPSLAAVAKTGSFDEHLFFDKVRAALHYKEVYDNFLRCLRLFNEDVVTKSELLKVATSFLGRFPELLKEFKGMLGFKESGDNIEAIPLKIIKYEQSKLDPEVALDIDYSTGGRNGASYRALPKNLKQPICSGRTQLCKEVLNDIWVSFPSWSEDSTFVTSCKTEFEEMIYRCEDERFELDMAIKTNAHTVQVLENIQKRINKMTAEERSVFSLDDYLGGTSTVLHQKALHRCYGDKTDELVEGLKRNPVVAVPIILKRLRGKEEEWKEKQRTYNGVWRDQIDNFYLKSLDHRGINFKQNDSKSFRSKWFLNEMEMVFAERKENSGINAALPHFLLEFKEMCVFLDAINLICQYLKKIPGIPRDDRRRIELVVRHFIPDFFGFPRVPMPAVEGAADEVDEDIPARNDIEEIEEQPRPSPEVMEIDDNNNEERSGHTSPTESAILSKDDEFSDPEGSNSVEENEISDESDKNGFIEDSDIFDKLDTVLPTTMPYTLIFVNKSWYVFFRQFHILCERLSRLLFESKRKSAVSPIRTDPAVSEDETVVVKPSYEELIIKLSKLLSGAIDYATFEDDSRSLFGIHAFVSFTMDKLILNIVRQLQQVIGDDICKQCTSFFFRHNKVIASGTFISALESAQVEKEYLKKVERILNDEKCFKVAWHKKDQTLTIELIEHVVEPVNDPYEVEKWSNYLDSFVNEEETSMDLLSEETGLPVFLPRNLRKQKEYWKRKVIKVENLWQKRHSPTYLKKNLPLLCKRKAYAHSSPIPYKSVKPRLDEFISACSEIFNSDEGVPQTSQSKDATSEVPECSKSNITIDDSDIFDDASKLSEKNSVIEEETCEIEMEIDNFVIVSDISNQSVEVKCEELESVHSFTEEKTLCSAISEASNEECTFVSNAPASSAGSEKGENYTFDINEVSVCPKEDEQNTDIVAAFHDVTEEVNIDDDVVDVKQEEPELEIITVTDSGDELNVVSDTDSVDKKVKLEEPKEVIVPVKRRKPARKFASVRPRRSRASQDYVKRRNKRNAARAQKERKARNERKKLEEFDYSTFDYAYFSELSEEDKCSYLTMEHFIVVDNTEATFTWENFQLVFVQYCNMFLYRWNCFTKAKEQHLQVSEIKTSNFNAWHRVWLDRYVTPTMLKSCNDWFMKSDPEKFRLVCVSASDCTKPPYIPYSKYRVRYYKTEP